MKKIILSIAILVSLQSFGQGKSVKGSGDIGMYQASKDTAAIRKEQEAANKFVNDLITKTSIADFQKWMYETIPAKQMNEASFQQLYNFFIQQKYLASKEGKK